MVFLNKKSNKKIYQNLINIKGLGESRSKRICKKLGFQDQCTLEDLNSLLGDQLENYLSNNFILEKLVEEQVSQDIHFKIDLGLYRGRRHILGYPVRGQRTLSNGKTQKRTHKARFKYNNKLLSYVFFKNKRRGKVKSNKLFSKKKVNNVIVKRSSNNFSKPKNLAHVRTSDLDLKSNDGTNEFIARNRGKINYFKKKDKNKKLQQQRQQSVHQRQNDRQNYQKNASGVHVHNRKRSKMSG